MSLARFLLLGDAYLFSFHMAKHIFLLLIAPALLLLAMPRAWVETAMRRPAIAALERGINRPVLTWITGVGAMILWHLPAVLAASMNWKPLHMVEPLSLVICGAIYWWPILSPLPRLRMAPVPHAAAYLFFSCATCTAMGIVITFSPLLYAGYAMPADPYGMLPAIRDNWGISPQMDQQIGGLLMWVPACMIYLAAIMAMFARWYAEETAAVEV